MKGVTPEQVLDGIPGYADAQVTAQLSDGPTNASYLLEHGGGQFVLRVDKPGAVDLGLSRHHEKRISTIVYQAGIAPETLYFDDAAGVCLRRYLPGRSWTIHDLVNPVNLARLARLLRDVHALGRAGPAFEPLSAARRYARQLGCERSRFILLQAERLINEIGSHAVELTLCHNDLVCQNVLEGQGLKLIDWEYAGDGDPFFDLAVVVRHHGLEHQAAHGFLDAYLERAATERERQRLGMLCEFYGCLLELWNLRTAVDRG